MSKLGKFVAIALALFAALYVFAMLHGCSPSPPVAAAYDVAGHSAALMACRERGKDAGSYAIYHACADAVDDRFWKDGGL